MPLHVIRIAKNGVCRTGNVDGFSKFCHIFRLSFVTLADALWQELANYFRRERVMMISDVILEANTEYEIYFLLTAYVESVRYCDKLSTLPENFTRLPLTGIGDVRTRLEGFGLALEKPSSSAHGRERVTLREAADIFGAALDRLQWLDQKACVRFRTEDRLTSLQPA